MTSDRISNLIIQLKNAGATGKEIAVVPYTKHVEAIAEALKRVGYVSEVVKKGKKVQKLLEIKLAYKGTVPMIQNVKRISKSSKRTYLPVDKIFSVRDGFGNLLLSTPKGILTDKEARKAKVGGEALFEVW